MSEETLFTAARRVVRDCQIDLNKGGLITVRRMIGHRAMLGAIALVADGRKALAIGAVADPAVPIPPQNILDMFRTA